MLRVRAVRAIAGWQLPGDLVFSSHAVPPAERTPQRFAESWRLLANTLQAMVMILVDSTLCFASC